MIEKENGLDEFINDLRQDILKDLISCLDFSDKICKKWNGYSRS